ncbi:hypothetical protein ABMA72_16105, partial [Halobacteriovorax sp. CON-3]
KPQPQVNPNLNQVPKPQPQVNPNLNQVPKPQPQVNQNLNQVPKPQPQVNPNLNQVPKPQPQVNPNLNQVPKPQPQVNPNLNQVPKPQPQVNPNLNQVPKPQPPIINPGGQQLPSHVNPPGLQKPKPPQNTGGVHLPSKPNQVTPSIPSQVGIGSTQSPLKNRINKVKLIYRHKDNSILNEEEVNKLKDQGIILDNGALTQKGFSLGIKIQRLAEPRIREFPINSDINNNDQKNDVGPQISAKNEKWWDWRPLATACLLAVLLTLNLTDDSKKSDE